MGRKPGAQHNVQKQGLHSFYVVTRAEEAFARLSLGFELPPGSSTGKVTCSPGGGGPNSEPHRGWFTLCHSFTMRVVEHSVRQEDSLAIPTLLFGCHEAVINGDREGK